MVETDRTSTDEPALVLASGSPRRRDMLTRFGVGFVVRPVDIDETPRPGEEAPVYVARLAREKAEAAVRPGEIVLAADTIVTLDGALLGKPRDDTDAARMLAALSGRSHQVLTGVAILAGAHRVEHVERTDVRFGALDAEEIDAYVDTREPHDKAGGYGIQGRGALFVEAIEGNYDNVAGLPLAAVYRMLRRCGVDLLRPRA